MAGSGNAAPPPSLRPSRPSHPTTGQTPRPPHARPRLLTRALRRSAGPHARSRASPAKNPTSVAPCCAQSNRFAQRRRNIEGRIHRPVASTNERGAPQGAIMCTVSTTCRPLSTIRFPPPAASPQIGPASAPLRAAFVRAQGCFGVALCETRKGATAVFVSLESHAWPCFGFFLGRPTGRRLDITPSRRAVACTHRSSP